MAPYRLLWLEVARDHDASLPPELRRQVASRLERLLTHPRPPDAGHDQLTDRWTTTYGDGEGVMIFLPELREIVEEQLVDVLQTDITHAGGFTGLRAVASWAGTYDLVVAPHNVCGPVGTMANVHLAVATHNHAVLEHFNDFADPWVLDLVEGAPRVDGEGFFGVPEAPGLGVHLRPEVCAEHQRTSAYFDLYRDGWERRE